MAKVKGIKLRRAVAARLLLLREVKFTNNASDMARSVGLTPQRWYNYETGRRALDLYTATRVVEAHDVDFNWLYGGVMKGLSRALADAIRAQRSKPRRKRKPRRYAKKKATPAKVDAVAETPAAYTDRSSHKM